MKQAHAPHCAAAQRQHLAERHCAQRTMPVLHIRRGTGSTGAAHRQLGRALRRHCAALRWAALHQVAKLLMRQHGWEW
jgi:hypothetical protein